MSTDWIGIVPTTESPFYPYIKVTAGNSMKGIDVLPYRLMKYLMDMPSRGYTPPSDNKYPRARLKKLLYWDGALPLEQPLPTAEQMLSIEFDPTRPGSPPDTERGFRIFPQELVRQSQTSAQSIVRIYLGTTQRMQQKNTYVYRTSVIFCVMVNYDLESNMETQANSRSLAITQAIQEATEGVNFGGIGGLNTYQITKFDDERTNTGYKIYQYIDWNGDDLETDIGT